MDRSAIIRDAGLAALTCARLLREAGWRVTLESVAEPRELHLLLQERTAALLCALWQDPALLVGAHRVGTRMVCWGDSGPGTEIDAPGVAIAAGELVRRLAARLGPLQAGEGEWIIEGRGDARAQFKTFGQRNAWVAPARLREAACAAMSVMEATPDGWVFLVPSGGGAANLQCVRSSGGDCETSPDTIVADTRFVACSVEGGGAWAGPFPAMPRLRVMPARLPARDAPGSIAVGESAACFDPVSGDGVGHALRGAVLATRVLQSIAGGASPQACLAQYAHTLARAMSHHLALCADFYRSKERQALLF